MLSSLSSSASASAACAASARWPSANCVNARTFGSLAALFRIVESFAVASTVALARSGRHPQADTRRVVFDFASRLAPLGYVETCVCLHALSSFQRTDPWAASFAARTPEPFSREPFDVTSPGRPCQPLSCRPTSFPEPAPKRTSFRGTLRKYQIRLPVSSPFSHPCEICPGPPRDLLQAETRNAPSLSGAPGHRRHGGSRPRQIATIRRAAGPVNHGHILRSGDREI
jgi:hypothetical protein